MTEAVQVAREIRSRQSSHVLPDLLQTVFAAELLLPSRELWLVSPWISNIPLLNNTTGQFTPIAPEWGRASVRLSEVLVHLAERGTRVRVVTRDTDINAPFCGRLQEAATTGAGSIHVHVSQRLHEKGLLGDRYYLQGSVNFTVSGISLNEEKALFHRDPRVIAENRIALQGRWLREQE